LIMTLREPSQALRTFPVSWVGMPWFYSVLYWWRDWWQRSTLIHSLNTQKHPQSQTDSSTENSWLLFNNQSL